MNGSVAQIRPHVPVGLVRDFDYTAPPDLGSRTDDVYCAWHRLHDGPDIFWTPRHGGHWVLTRAEDIRWAQASYKIFSHEVFTIPPPPEPMLMPPVTVDPPLHAKYRALINPAFTPSAVKESEQIARELTISLVEMLRPLGGCDFVRDFASVMPVTIFLRLIDLPLEMREQFTEWATAYMLTKDAQHRQRFANSMMSYLSEIVRHRIDNRGRDLISRILAGHDKDRFGSERELLGMVLLLFLGGLDTVANLLSFTTLHLARRPELQRRLVNEPEIIPAAIEEFIRRTGLSNTGRIVKADTSYKEAFFKRGDMVMIPIGMSSMDDRMYQNPLEIDFNRSNLRDHNTFGNGPHKCPGSQLARAELKVFLEEWLKRIPDFHLCPDKKIITQSGLMNSFTSLPIRWS